MIHEEICTYEVCKLAKEKGFPLRKVIKQDGCAFFYELPQSQPDWANCDAWYLPTQSLLQRWLREEKDIHISINYQQGVDEECPSYDYSVYRWPINTDAFVSEKWKDGYSTYELALEDALKYTLENLV